MLDNVFMCVLDMSKTAAIVIAVVLLARLLLKKAPKWISYALWAVVLLRLICPISIEAPVSAMPRMESVSAQRVDAALPRLEFETLSDMQYNRYVMEHTAPGEPFAQVSRSLEPTQWLSFIWLAGIAAMLIYSAVSYFRLRRRLVDAVPLRDNILLADHITSPFVMGLFRPRIYLPSTLGEREQEYIILHERCHIRRLDHVMKALGFFALCVHWFNPLVWLAFVLAGKDMEMSCDERVIKELGEDIRADYSASLLGLATGRRVIAGTPLAFGEGDTRGRIKNLAKWKKPVIWIVIIAVLLCAVLAVCLLTDPMDKGDLLRSEKREHGLDFNAVYEMELGKEVKSGTVVAEIWTNGECRQSVPVSFTAEDTELNISMRMRREDGKYTGIDIEINPSPSAGSLITYFPIPEYESIGWSTTAYEPRDEVEVKPGEAEIIAAMAFDLGNGVRSMDCQTLTEEPWRLEEYDCIITVLAGFSSEEVPPQQTSLIDPEPPKQVLQLADVIKLAEKGYELDWDDFEDFDYGETGSGLYIRVYEIDETFSLHIGGSAGPFDGEAPWYIYLSANDLDTRIDIRDGGVEEFIAEHGGKPAKLSDEKIAELRELYPADTHGYAIDMEYTLEETEGLAVVTVTDELVYRYDMEYLPVWVDEVIYGEGMPKTGTAVELWLGNTWLITNESGHRGVPYGVRYLCFIDLHKNHGFSTSNAIMAYLTEDGYLMPVDAKGAFAEYEGWSVEAFLSACGITGEVTVDDSALERMASLRPEDIKEITGAEGIDPTAMAEALNSAAANPTEPVEGYMGHWNVDVYTGVGDECFRLYAGAEKNVVMMYYHTDKSEYTTWYFKDKTLYDLIRGAFTYEGLIEEAELAKYEDIIAVRAEGTIRDHNRVSPGRLNGYEITEFYEHDRFKNGDEQFVVYKWDVAFTTANPDKVAWAGGMWMDGLLRVRAYELCNYFVVRTVDGELQDYQFLFWDIYTGEGGDEERERAWREIQLAWGREVGKMAEIEDFINAMPNNGFVAMISYENVWEADLYQLIYQCTDDTVAYEDVRDAYEAEVGEVFTDLSYISRANLDKLLLKLTGYGLDDKEWNFGYTNYLESIDVYCIMHGDTNYDPLDCYSLQNEGDIYTAYCSRRFDDSESVSHTVTLRDIGNGEYQFISCKKEH